MIFNFRRPLRGPNHGGGWHFTSTDADEAGILAHLLLQARIAIVAHSEDWLFVHITTPQGDSNPRGSRRQAGTVKNLSIASIA